MFARKSRVGLSRRLDESNAGKPTSSEDSCETNGPKLWAAIGTGYPSLSPREEDENAKLYAIGNPYGHDFFRLCSSESYRCSATEWDNFNMKHARMNRRIYDSAYAARLLAGKTISTLGGLATAIFGAWIGGAVPGAPNIMKGCTGPSEYVANGVYKCGIAMMQLSFYKEGNEDDTYTYQSCVFNIFDEVGRFIKSGSRFGTLTLGCTDLWYCNATVEFVLENSEWSNESSTWTLASTSGVAYYDGGEGGGYSGYEWEVENYRVPPGWSFHNGTWTENEGNTSDYTSLSGSRRVWSEVLSDDMKQACVFYDSHCPLDRGNDTYEMELHGCRTDKMTNAFRNLAVGPDLLLAVLRGNETAKRSHTQAAFDLLSAIDDSDCNATS